MNIQELDAQMTAAETSADATEQLFSMEAEASHIAEHIHALAVRMDNAGWPAHLLANAYIDLLAVAATFGLTGDLALADTAAKLESLVNVTEVTVG